MPLPFSFLNKPTVAGVPLWVDSTTTGLATGISDAAGDTQYGIIGALITNTVSGTCSRLRMYSGTVGFATTIKIGIFDSSGNRLGQTAASAIAGANNTWYDYAVVSPFAVTASTDYIVGWTILDAAYVYGKREVGSARGRQRLPTTAGGDGDYGTFAKTSYTFTTPTSINLVGMYVT